MSVFKQYYPKAVSSNSSKNIKYIDYTSKVLIIYLLDEILVLPRNKYKKLTSCSKEQILKYVIDNNRQCIEWPELGLIILISDVANDTNSTFNT